MVNTWLAASLAAVVAGVVGFFVVVRGETFPAHAIANGAFAGATGATLLGLSPLLGLASFSLLGAGGVAVLRRRAQSDVATGIVLVALLALGAAFVSQTTTYQGQVVGLLFGTLFGVSHQQLLWLGVIAVVCCLTVIALFRPLLLSALAPDVARGRGVKVGLLNGIFLVVIAAATTLSIPVVGTFLVFSLMIGPPAAARRLVPSPSRAMGLSVAFTLTIAWGSIASAYATNWPVGFFVGSYAGALYLLTNWWSRTQGH